jgi:hypothetical protein
MKQVEGPTYNHEEKGKSLITIYVTSSYSAVEYRALHHTVD